jgi:L-ascorbate metabolism protein UlaG (beta-lactamase superfamily)
MKKFIVNIIFLFLLSVLFLGCASTNKYNVKQIDIAGIEQAPDINIKIKWYGTAMVQLEYDGTRLLFDPFITINNKLYKPFVYEFTSADAILVTHGHFDHIADIPDILEVTNSQTEVYCTQKPKETLISQGVDEGRINIIAPNDELKLDSFFIRVLKGKHIVYDNWLVFKTSLHPRNLFYMGNLFKMLKAAKDLDEAANETVVFDISVENKRLLLLGSLNLDDDTEYPTGADLLILPLQGRSDIAKYAMNIIERLRPKKVLLDHFDDSFPPISSFVNPNPFITLMEEKFPDVPVIRLPYGVTTLF